MATQKELRKKAYDELLSGDVPQATKNITVEPSKQEQRDDVITGTAQQLLANKQARQAPVAAPSTQSSGGGFNAGDFGNKALGLLGNLKKSDIAGIMAGASADKGNTFYGKGMADQAARLGEEEVREKEAEAMRNLEAQKLSAMMQGKQMENATEMAKLQKQGELQQQELTAKEQQAAQKELDDFAESIAKTLPPDQAAKVRALNYDQKLAIKQNPDILKGAGIMSYIPNAPKARLKEDNFQQITSNGSKKADPLGIF